MVGGVFLAAWRDGPVGDGGCVSEESSESVREIEFGQTDPKIKDRSTNGSEVEVVRALLALLKVVWALVVCLSVRETVRTTTRQHQCRNLTPDIHPQANERVDDQLWELKARFSSSVTVSPSLNPVPRSSDSAFLSSHDGQKSSTVVQRSMVSTTSSCEAQKPYKRSLPLYIHWLIRPGLT